MRRSELALRLLTHPHPNPLPEGEGVVSWGGKKSERGAAAASLALRGWRVQASSIVVGPGFAESGYSVVYELPIPGAAAFNFGAVPYTTDNSGEQSPCSTTFVVDPPSWKAISFRPCSDSSTMDRRSPPRA